MALTSLRLEIELDGCGAGTWEVWASEAEASVAAAQASDHGCRHGEKQEEEEEASERRRQKDPILGLTHFRATKVRPGRVSLDDIEAVTEESRHTWSAALTEIGLDTSRVGGWHWIELDTSRVGCWHSRVEGRTSAGGCIRWELPAMTKPQGSKAPASEKVKKKAKRPQEGRTTVAVEKSPTSLWGRIYVVPGRRIGEGSYHFLEQEQAYLNYENMPDSMRLKDGSTYPKRLDFREVRYNAAKRRFQGIIDWNVSNKARWEYDITFDAAFVGISGACRMFQPDAKDPYCKIAFREDAKYVWSQATKAQIQGYLGQWEVDPAIEQIIDAMGRAAERDCRAREKAGKGRASGQESLNVIFGQAMQTYARDKKFDDMLSGSFAIRTGGAKLGGPTRWDHKRS